MADQKMVHIGGQCKVVQVKVVLGIVEASGREVELELLNRVNLEGFGEDLVWSHSRPLTPEYEAGKLTATGFRQSGKESFQLSFTDGSNDGKRVG
jgi:hypothetical protein